MLCLQSVSVSTHTNYLMLEFLKNVASFLSKRAAYSIEAALDVKRFFLNLFNRLTFWIFPLPLPESGGAFYSTLKSCQALIFKNSFKIKHLTQLQTTLSDHSQSRWRILRSYWPKSTPFSRFFQQPSIRENLVSHWKIKLFQSTQHAVAVERGAL